MPDGLMVDSSAHRGVGSYPPSSAHPARVGPWLTGLCCLAGIFALYLCQSRTAPVSSDGAANVLQGQAMVTGNPLLRGWWTSDVSFYATELPEYALVTAIRGLSPDVVHVCGALTYTLTVLLAALVASGAPAGRGAAVRRAGRINWHRAAVAAGIMLAPSILGGTEVFLENPDHAGTAVPVLLVLLIMARAGRRAARPPRRAGAASIIQLTARGAKRWSGPGAICVVLALAQVSDALTLVAGTIPLIAVCGLRLLMRRQAGHPLRDKGPRRRDARTDEALLAAAVLSIGLATLAGIIIRVLGGFDLRPLGSVGLAGPRQVPASARVLWQSLVLLFGANNPGTPHQPQTIKAHALLVGMADFHVIGLLLAGAGLAAGIAACLSRRADRVTQVLVAAVIAVAAAGAGTTVLRSLSNAHEVAVLLPLGAALAGRMLPNRGRGRPARAVTAALTVWLAVGLAELCYAAAWPPAPPARQALAGWLISHHEHTGLAGYWQASATTVTSGGRVLVAPITLPAKAAGSGSRTLDAAAGQASADRWESAADWYQPGRHVATFVIAVSGHDAPGAGLSPGEVRALFGKPAGQQRIGQDVIMLYRYNLLTRLRPTTFPGSS